MNNINFTANFIKNANVLKKNRDGDYTPAKVSIVELDKNDSQDQSSLCKTALEWKQKGARYSSSIMVEFLKETEYRDVEKEHYFAVTEQKDNYEELDSDKILGLMMFSESKYNLNEINWLQVKPDINFVNSHDRAYKHIGKSLMDLLKERYMTKTIFVKSSSPAISFYKDQNFKNMVNDMEDCLYLEA